MFFSDVGDAFVAMNKDDSVIFKSRGNSDQNVTFKDGVSPCEDGNTTRSACKVSVKRGLYAFDCPGCPDPGIAVGSSSSIYKTTAAIITGPYAAPKNPKIFCKSQVPSVQAIQVRDGETFEFYPVGDFDFSIDMGPYCTQTSPLNNMNPTCTFHGTAPPSAPIMMKVVGCGAENVTLNITPH